MLNIFRFLFSPISSMFFLFILSFLVDFKTTAYVYFPLYTYTVIFFKTSVFYDKNICLLSKPQSLFLSIHALPRLEMLHVQRAWSKYCCLTGQVFLCLVAYPVSKRHFELGHDYVMMCSFPLNCPMLFLKGTTSMWSSFSFFVFRKIMYLLKSLVRW